MLKFSLQFMGGSGVKQKIKGVYVHGNVGELPLSRRTTQPSRVANPAILCA